MGLVHKTAGTGDASDSASYSNLISQYGTEFFWVPTGERYG